MSVLGFIQKVGRVISRFLMLASVLGSMGPSASAQGVSAFQLEQKKEGDKKRKMLLTSVLARDSNLVSDKDNLSSSSSLSLTPRYKFNSSHLVSALLNVARDHVADTDYQLANTRLSYRYSQKFEVSGERVKLLQTAAVTLPTDSNARETMGFQTSIFYEPRLAFNWGILGINIPATYGIRMQKFFYRPSREINADDFNDLIIRHRLQLEQKIMKTRFSVGGTFRLRNYWDSVGRPGMRYRILQFLGYELSQQTIFQVGHLYGDRIYHREEGVFRAEKYVRERSSFYSNLIFVF